MSEQYTELHVPVAKVSTDKRMVFGWGQVVTKNGSEFYDTDNQSFGKAETFDAWKDFAKGDRVMLEMHDGESKGTISFIFPAYDEILKSLGFEPIDQEGFIVGAEIDDDATLAKFDSGELTGFSIGGACQWEDVE